MGPTGASKPSPVKHSRRRLGDHVAAGQGTHGGSWSGPGVVRAVESVRSFQTVRVAACGCSVGAGGTARKPLAALELGLTAALRVRFAPAVGAGCRLVSHPNPPERAKEDTMNRWTGTGHLTKDPKFLETDGGTAICTLRIAVKRAGKQAYDGYFDVRTFDGQAHACADYLKAGREVAIDGRLLFDEFQTQDGSYASRVYIVAERVEFLASRNRSTGQASSEASPEQPATDGAAREAHQAA